MVVSKSIFSGSSSYCQRVCYKAFLLILFVFLFKIAGACYKETAPSLFLIASEIPIKPDSLNISIYNSNNSNTIFRIRLGQISTVSVNDSADAYIIYPRFCSWLCFFT